jgi:hypothetical protein
LNEQQATLLITYLKNTSFVRRFKKELVRQFYAMREELMKRHVQREQLKPVRIELTDAIRDNMPETPHKGFAYKHFTDLAYKMAIGKTAGQLRKTRNAPSHAAAVDYMTAAEMEAVKQAEYRIAALVAIGMVYEQVKELVYRRIAA